MTSTKVLHSSLRSLPGLLVFPSTDVCAVVHKLFSITTTFEWINTDKRCLNIVPELCFDSCRLYCLPPGLPFNYIRLTQCFICHPWLIAERDKFSHGMNRFSFSRCHDVVFAALYFNHYPRSVIMVRKRNGLSKRWAVVQGIGVCFVWWWSPAAKAFLAESMSCGIIRNPKGQLYFHQLTGPGNWLQNERKIVLALERLLKLCSHLSIVT